MKKQDEPSDRVFIRTPLMILREKNEILKKACIAKDEEIRELKVVISELLKIGELEDIVFTDEAATKLFQFWVNHANNLIAL